MDVDTWNAHKTDGPYYIQVNNSTSNSDVDNIQQESSRAPSRSPWKSWNFKKVAHVVWYVALFVLHLFILVANGLRHLYFISPQLMDFVVKVLYDFIYQFTVCFIELNTVLQC
jgi:hypothetical protein